MLRAGYAGVVATHLALRSSAGASAAARAAASTARSFASLPSTQIDQIRQREKVSVFIKTYCKFCNDVVERLEDADIPAKVVALDKLDNTAEVQSKLKAETGQEHVPYLFIAGRHIPSAQALEGLKAPGTLRKTFEEAGVPVKGYFRT
jgi:glutaredoxin